MILVLFFMLAGSFFLWLLFRAVSRPADPPIPLPLHHNALCHLDPVRPGKRPAWWAADAAETYVRQHCAPRDEDPPSV